MASQKRSQVLADPLADPELQPIHPPPDNFDITPTPMVPYADTQGWGRVDWQAWGDAKFGSQTVGEYAFQLGEEQRKLLWVALLHALEPAHQGHVTLRKRITVYALDHWGLEVIDQAIDQEPGKNMQVLPLFIVFVEPPPAQP